MAKRKKTYGVQRFINWEFKLKSAIGFALWMNLEPSKMDRGRQLGGSRFISFLARLVFHYVAKVLVHSLIFLYFFKNI